MVITPTTKSNYIVSFLRNAPSHLDCVMRATENSIHLTFGDAGFPGCKMLTIAGQDASKWFLYVLGNHIDHSENDKILNAVMKAWALKPGQSV